MKRSRPALIRAQRKDPRDRSIRRLALALSVAACTVLLVQCADPDEGFLPHFEPIPPTGIVIESGNNQFSMRGTELPVPLAVRVTGANGKPAEGVTISFSVTAGGGSLSVTKAQTNAAGRASTRLTLGIDEGPNRVAAVVDFDQSLFVVFEAMSSRFLCQEAEDSLKVCGSCATSYGAKDDLFLVTPRSAAFPNLSAGIVQINLSTPAALEFAELPPEQGIFPPIIWDAAFSARGDYFVSRRTIFPEIIKVDLAGNTSVFATLDQDLPDEVEIAMNPSGLLIGCDNKGPFVVRCPPDSLLRLSGAIFSGGVNNDALAVDPRRHADDPLGEDIYFIYTPDASLRRVPMDSMTVETPPGVQVVTTLTEDQAKDARGMACNDANGNVYILVDNDSTKVLLEVTPGGGVTTLFDFFTRGSGSREDAGTQRDLAFRNPFLMTLDTYNDNLLVYNLSGTFTELFADSLSQSLLSERDSGGNKSGGERVGLDVLR